MNILFFIRPKEEVAYIYNDDTLRQTLEKMEHHGYSAIPVIDHKSGVYIGTITEGDLLWYVKDRHGLTIKDAENIPILSINRKKDNEPVDIDANMEDLLHKVMNQNFVPVIDGRNRFIGIVTRKDVIQHLCEKCGLNK
ncbi:CBS domain-containing protein [Kineothrix sp. MB12-C1]|uniref:CBS domain-containing protein n=1 Tax=Kineothrix sp. MB12-C1 TaxID=3070215 RepID=UPI0027D32D58|nr:CBS domain-containing protein [Kineothrix sp. MB12-C1]WMC93606.1 CBS domain-containing protein [Kineothrix sp. MB12-C1]